MVGNPWLVSHGCVYIAPFPTFLPAVCKQSYLSELVRLLLLWQNTWQNQEDVWAQGCVGVSPSWWGKDGELSSSTLRGQEAATGEAEEGVLHYWAFSFFLYPLWAWTYIWIAPFTFKTNLTPLVNPLRNTFTDTQQCALPILLGAFQSDQVDKTNHYGQGRWLSR